MITPLPRGTLVRTTRDLLGPDAFDHVNRSKGFEFEVEDFVSAKEANRDVAFYWGNQGGGMNNVAVQADAVEVVRTAEEQAARRPPDMPALRRMLGSALLDDGDGFKITETNYDGDDAMELYGRTSKDLPFGVRVRIVDVWVTDD